MDIGVLSMAMAQTNLLNQVGTALLGQSLDQFEESGADVAKMLEQSVNPNLGANIDISI